MRKEGGEEQEEGEEEMEGRWGKGEMIEEWSKEGLFLKHVWSGLEGLMANAHGMFESIATTR